VTDRLPGLERALGVRRLGDRGSGSSSSSSRFARSDPGGSRERQSGDYTRDESLKFAKSAISLPRSYRNGKARESRGEARSRKLRPSLGAWTTEAAEWQGVRKHPVRRE